MLQPGGAPVAGAWVGTSRGWFGATDGNGYYYLEEPYPDTLFIHATGFADWTGNVPEPEGTIFLPVAVIDSGESIFVRASRGSLAGSLPSTDTVTGAGLMKLGYSGMDGLNGMIAGVNVREYGGSMPVVSISLRGGEPSQSDYMLDGVSMVSPGDGIPKGIFDPAVFSAMEIARGGAGPGGSGTGSAGAINYLPPPASQPLYVSVMGISNGRASVSARLKGAGISLRRNIGVHGTEGYSTTLLTTGSFGSVRGGFLGGWASGDTEAPDWTVQGDGYREQGQAECWVNWICNDLEGDLSAGMGRMVYTQSEPYTADDTHRDCTGRLSLSWKGPVTLRTGFSTSAVNSTATGHHNVHSGTLGAECSTGILYTSAGYRLDSNGAGFSGRINLEEGLSGEHITVRGSLFTDHRIPTLNDLYWPFDGMTSGNPELKSERSAGGEAGFSFTGRFLKTDVCCFITSTRDLIIWLPDEDGIWTPSNISSSLSRGIEASGEFAGSPGSLRGTFTWNIATDQTVDTPREGMLIPYRPEYTWGISAITSLPMGICAEVDLTGMGKRFTNRTQTEFLEEYWIMNCGISRAISGSVRASVIAGNVFDEEYLVTAGYPGQSRTFGISIEYTGE